MTEAAAPGGGARLTEAAAPTGLETAFGELRGHLLGLLYRLTGSRADAEDLVQATFERALSRPPADTSRPWRPWLVRVALNLGRDHLRRRRRRAYDGPWLPEPLEIPDPGASPRAEVPPGFFAEPAGTEGRYELLESVSFAFLVALETLTPTQRAVLLLRDVFEYSGRETAEALELSEAGVRQHLHRARRALADYERGAGPRRRLDEAAVQDILGRFLGALAGGDVAAVEALLAEDVVLRTDAGGEFHAARVDVAGRNKVARFYVNISKLAGMPRAAIRTLNGAPAVISELDEPKPGIAPRVVTLVDLDAEGRLARIYAVLASAKLAGIDPL